jgi:manganese/zinc/iron transport system ATP- binding protein
MKIHGEIIMSSYALDVHNLTVAYKEKAVLQDIDISVPQGVLVGIVGPNGAGKTTFIKSILGLVKPMHATISVLGKPLSRDMFSKIAYVPQRSSIDWDFPINALDVVLMGSYKKLGWLKRPGSQEYEQAHQALEKVGLSAYASRQIGQLSGGQQQRVFLARALVQNADIYLMDEPFAGVDIASEKTIIDVLKTLINQGKTGLVVHHDLHTVQSYFDWLLMLNIHKVACGPVETVFTTENIIATYGKQLG